MNSFKKLLFLSIFMVSCMTQKQLAERCQKEFPTPAPLQVIKIVKRDSFRTDTIKGQTDTLIVVKDTTQCPPSVSGTTIVKNVPCNCPAPIKIVHTNYETITETITKIDSTNSYLKHIEIQKLKTQNAVLRSKYHLSLGIFFTSWFLLMLYLFLTSYIKNTKKSTPSV